MRILVLISLLSGSRAVKLSDELLTQDYISDLRKLVSEITLNIKSTHCFAMIWDEVYKDVPQPELLKEQPMFVATISESEDLKKPSPTTVAMLKTIQREFCDVYVILIANGIQMVRFLQHSDDMRMLNTRAKFVLLHDYRLFTRPLHYLWRRIINVVFIRPSDPNIDITKAGRRFELSTVPFPSQLKGVFVMKRVDFWQGGRFWRTRGDLFRDRTQNLVNNTFRAVVLVHTPGVMKRASGYSGLEIRIIRALEGVLNFTTDFYELEDSAQVKWGMVDENNTATGLLGEMDAARADFALADLYYTSYHLKILDLSVPFMTECLTFLTPEATSDNSWQTLILPFAPSLWIGILTSLFSVGFIFYGVSVLFNLIQKTEVGHKDIFDDCSNCVLYTFSMLNYVSLPKFPEAWSLRMLTGWYWIYCILIVASYRASMTAILSNPFPRVTIDTIVELADSGLDIGIWGRENKGFFQMADDQYSQKIGKNAQDYVDPIAATKKVADGSFAFYENEHFLKAMRSQQKSSSSSLSLHVMKQCAVNMPVSVGLEKNSPLKEQVDKYLQRMIETGLIRKWLKDSVEEFEASREEPPQEAIMDLKKLYAGIVALGIGYFLGIVALVGEVVFWKCYIEKHPLYDKFLMVEFYQNYRLKQ